MYGINNCGRRYAGSKRDFRMNFEYIKCNLCGADETKTLVPDGFLAIVQCLKCGLIYRNPRRFQEQILKEISNDGIFAEHIEEVWRHSKTRIFRNCLRIIERFSPKGSLLDVGCGYGIFLKMAEEKGWQVQGVEVSQSACKYARENLHLDVFQGTLEQANLPDNSFDVITLWEVMGEVLDPFAVLRQVKRILKQRGLIALRLHNATFHVFVHYLLKGLGNIDKKLRISPTIFHLYNFSPQTIRKMLTKAGFQDIRVYVCEPTSGDPYSSGGILGEFGVVIIKKIVFLLSRAIFYISFGSLVLSPSMLIFAKKSS